jgi:hypothetical protein
MRQIVGLGYGFVTFTPGAAGAGTLVFSGFTGFAPSRLMVVSNVTRKIVIYAVEKTGRAGAWSSVTSAGGTLTLDVNTAGYNAADVLRCIYDTDEAPSTVHLCGGNLWPIPLDACTLAAGNSRTADYGPGPRPGTRATRLVLADDNAGANTGALTLAGRTDGALFGLAVDIKGTGTLELRIRATGVASGIVETVGTLAITADSTWRRYILRGYVAQFDCMSIQAEIRATGGGATIDASNPDFRLLDSASNFPEYQPPTGVAQTVYITKRLGVSYSAWGDSITAGSGGNWHPELQRILGGSPYYMGGVGGEDSTEIKDRFVATTDAAKLHRSYGVQIIWAGNNNINFVSTWTADIDTMVQNMVHGRFLVCSHLGGNLAHADGQWPYLQESRRLLKSRFGTRYVDIDAILRAGTESNLACYRVDTIHPNAVGNGIIAQEIYKAMRRNGYLDGSLSGALDWGEVADADVAHSVPLITKVDASTDTATVLLPQAKRHGFIIVNNSTAASLYISLGWYTTAVYWIAKLAPGARYELIGSKYHGPVGGYWTSADGGNAVITEIV